MSDPHAPAPAEAAAPATQKLRLLVLLVLLGGAMGLWVIDTYHFQPVSKAVAEQLEKANDERNKLSIDAAQGKPFMQPEDVQRVIGFKPTQQTQVGKFKVEYYRWWGSLPMPKRFIAVAYQKRNDDGTWMYITHHLDQTLEEKDLPLSDEKATEIAKKALAESPNGPDRQMPIPALSTPPGSDPEKSAPAKEPEPTKEPSATPEPAPTKADEPEVKSVPEVKSDAKSEDKSSSSPGQEDDKKASDAP